MNGSLGDLLQAGQNAQGRGFAAARRSDNNQKLLTPERRRSQTLAKALTETERADRSARRPPLRRYGTITMLLMYSVRTRFVRLWPPAPISELTKTTTSMLSGIIIRRHCSVRATAGLLLSVHRPGL